MAKFLEKLRDIREQQWENYRKNGMAGMEMKEGQRTFIRKVNRFGVCYFIWFCTTALLVGTFVTIPEMYRNDTDKIPTRTFFSILAYLQVMVNFYMVAIKSKQDRYPGSGKNGFLPIQTRGDQWNTCKHCLIKAPPRSHHCPVCDSCILKRDHHCFFVYSCVGFHNQRYFIVMLFYSTFAGWYSLYLLREYLSNFYVDPFSGDFYRTILPIALYDLCTGVTTLGIFSLAMFLYCVIFSTLAATFFFLQQAFFSVVGRTTHEFQNEIKKYALGPFENLRTVFGPFGIINFLMPCPWLKSEGDGMNWKSKGI